MSVLNAKARGAIPAKQFGLPAKRAYPLNDPAHAANAKARAHQQLNKGGLSARDYQLIVAKADGVLGRK